MYCGFDKVKGILKEGDQLILKREPHNPYDSFALALYHGDFKLGYVPAEDNLLLSTMIDENIAIFEAETSSIHKTDSYWDKLEFVVRSYPRSTN